MYMSHPIFQKEEEIIVKTELRKFNKNNMSYFIRMKSYKNTYMIF